MPDKIVVAVAAIAIIVVVLAIALITTHNHGSPPATTTAEISGPGSKVHITATVNNNASNTINPSNVPSVKNQTNSTLPLVPHNAINSSAAPNFGGGPGQNYLSLAESMKLFGPNGQYFTSGEKNSSAQAQRINTTPGGKFAGYNITGAWLQYYTTALNGSISEQVYKSLMAKSLYSTLTKGYESSLYSTNETPVILAANATSNGMTYTALLAKGRGLLVGYTYLIGYKDNEVTSVVVSGNVALASNIVNQSMLASTVGSDMP